VAVGVVALLTLGGCGGSKAAPQTAPQITVSTEGPLSPALLSGSQLRRVPGFSTASVTPFAAVKVFEDPDPRGPCGGNVPVLKLDDAVGLSWSAQTIRGGAQLVIRRPAGEVKRYLTARLSDIRPQCDIYTTKTAEGVTQEVKYEGAIRVAPQADQSLAVVTAIKINGEVRAATAIEVRRGDVLSRTVIFTEAPMDNTIVRGIAALMAKGLDRLE
jgi:hypothetical protein